MNNDARNRLRAMGGIMASSPELMAVAPAADRVPFMPRPIRGPMSLNRALNDPGPTSLMEPPISGTAPVVPREVTGAARQRMLAGTEPSFGMGMGVGLGSLAPILEDDITPDDLLSASLASGTEPTSRPVVDSKPSSDIVSRQNELRARRGLPPLSPEQEQEFAKSAAAAPLPQDISRAAEIDAELAAIEDRKVGGAYGSSADATRQKSLETEKRQLGESAGKTLAAEDTVMAQPLVPKKLDQSVIDRMLELAKKDPNIPVPDDTPTSEDGAVTTPSPGGDGPPRKETKRDLRSRYNEKIALFKEIYGTDDKDEAQDRAMSLAMIGLAIAAGQSPDALTNIAQGLMVGAQGIGARREDERERERGLKTLALQTAIDQMGAETEAEQEAAAAALEQANKLELEEFKARLRSDGGSNLLSSSPASRIYKDAYKSVMDQINAGALTPPEGMSAEEFARSRAVPVALDTLSLDIAQGIITDPDQIAAIKIELQRLGGDNLSPQGVPDPKIQEKVKKSLETRTPEEVRNALRKSKIDPALYGL
jgi:hypothetical protein